MVRSMNEQIRELYDQAIVIEDGGDYVCGELDPEKFAELIVRECAGVGYEASYSECALNVSNKILEHFGVKE